MCYRLFLKRGSPCPQRADNPSYKRAQEADETDKEVKVEDGVTIKRVSISSTRAQVILNKVSGDTGKRNCNRLWKKYLLCWAITLGEGPTLTPSMYI